jgi:hypothetical protein
LRTIKTWEEWKTAEEIAARKKAATTFDKWDPEQHRRVAREGGRARHEKGTGHEFREGNPEAARAAQLKSAVARVRNRIARMQQCKALSTEDPTPGAAEE